MIRRGKAVIGEAVFGTCVICRLSTDRGQVIKDAYYCQKHMRLELERQPSRDYQKRVLKGKTDRSAVFARKAIVYDAPA